MEVVVVKANHLNLAEKINEVLTSSTNATVVAVIQNKIFEYTVVIQRETV